MNEEAPGRPRRFFYVYNGSKPDGRFGWEADARQAPPPATTSSEANSRKETARMRKLRERGLACSLKKSYFGGVAGLAAEAFIAAFA